MVSPNYSKHKKERRVERVMDPYQQHLSFAQHPQTYNNRHEVDYNQPPPSSSSLPSEIDTTNHEEGNFLVNDEDDETFDALSYEDNNSSVERVAHKVVVTTRDYSGDNDDSSEDDVQNEEFEIEELGGDDESLMSSEEDETRGVLRERKRKFSSQQSTNYNLDDGSSTEEEDNSDASKGQSKEDYGLRPIKDIYLRVMGQSTLKKIPGFSPDDWLLPNEHLATTLSVSPRVTLHDFEDEVKSVLAMKGLEIAAPTDVNNDSIYLLSQSPECIDWINNKSVKKKMQHNVNRITMPFNFKDILEEKAFLRKTKVSTSTAYLCEYAYVLDVMVYCKKKKATKSKSSNRSPPPPRLPMKSLHVKLLPPVYKNEEKGTHELQNTVSIPTLAEYQLDGPLPNGIVSWGLLQRTLYSICINDDTYKKGKHAIIGNHPRIYILNQSNQKGVMELTAEGGTLQMWDTFHQKNLIHFKKKEVVTKVQVVLGLGFSSAGASDRLNYDAIQFRTREFILLSQRYRDEEEDDMEQDATDELPNKLPSSKRRKQSRLPVDDNSPSSETYVTKARKFIEHLVCSESSDLYESMHSGHVHATSFYLSAKQRFGPLENQCAWDAYKLVPGRARSWPKLDQIIPNFQLRRWKKLSSMVDDKDYPQKGKYPLVNGKVRLVSSLPATSSSQKETNGIQGPGNGLYAITGEVKRQNDAILRQSSKGFAVSLRFVHKGRDDFNGCIISMETKDDATIGSAMKNWLSMDGGNNKRDKSKNDFMKFTDDEVAGLNDGSLCWCFEVNKRSFSKTELFSKTLPLLISSANVLSCSEIVVSVSAKPVPEQNDDDPNVVDLF